MIPLLQRIRIRQIQLCSKVLRRLSASPAFPFIRLARRMPITRGVLAALVGYNRPFVTLAQASAAISGIEGGGHSNLQYLGVKLPEAEKLRPGDEEALGQIQRILPRVRTVFDLGGSIGNLFYGYAKHLEMPADLVWTVCDLPATNRLGIEMAETVGERRLRFTDQIADASGSDLFVVSGALHYFEQPLADLLSGLGARPRYVLINRAPLVDGPAFATVQDGGNYRLACMLHNRKGLIEGLEAIGYEMVDGWRIPGRSVMVPCYPDRSAQAYSGMFFRQRAGFPA